MNADLARLMRHLHDGLDAAEEAAEGFNASLEEMVNARGFRCGDSREFVEHIESIVARLGAIAGTVFSTILVAASKQGE